MEIRGSAGGLWNLLARRRNVPDHPGRPPWRSRPQSLGQRFRLLEGRGGGLRVGRGSAPIAPLRFLVGPCPPLSRSLPRPPIRPAWVLVWDFPRNFGERSKAGSPWPGSLRRRPRSDPVVIPFPSTEPPTLAVRRCASPPWASGLLCNALFGHQTPGWVPGERGLYL